MIVSSLRLGQLEVPEDKIINMKKPILGFENMKRFCLVEIEDLAPFLWLQSIEDATISFLVVNPRVFMSEYKIEINSKEVAELSIENVDDVETYVVVTIADDAKMMTLNLQGPLLINTENNLGKQLVLVNSSYEVRHKVNLESNNENEETVTEETVTEEKVAVGV